MSFAFRITSISTTEPVTREELKAHLRIQSTAEDDLLDTYITASRQVAEQILKRSLINTEWQLTIDGFYSNHIELPMGAPLSTVSADVSIVYTKTTGDTTTLPSTCYTVDRNAEPAFVRLPNDDYTWPDDVQDTEGSVRITYRAGYSSVTSPITIAPQAIRTWIKIRAAQMYEFREPIITGTIVSELKRDFVDGLLDPYRLPSA